ncbi:hypothetical protein CkP1_0121 [Citrobacter phage CkP1]|nr:hypothetical protein CkP1_0121 [Citrobacter phage CkP1]
MNMSEEEKNYIIEQLDELISLAKHVADMSAFGTEDEYETANDNLQRQRKKILSMDGIEYD